MSTETSNQNQHFHQNGICSSIRVWTQNIFSHFSWDQIPNWVYHPECSSLFQLLILLQNKIQRGSKSRKPCRVRQSTVITRVKAKQMQKAVCFCNCISVVWLSTKLLAADSPGADFGQLTLVSTAPSSAKDGEGEVQSRRRKRMEKKQARKSDG
jgi:hypothetical protein